MAHSMLEFIGNVDFKDGTGWFDNTYYQKNPKIRFQFEVFEVK